MAEYDLRCVNCFHRSHEDKPCPYCPAPTKDNPNARCMEFVRADLFGARSIARIEQILSQGHGQMMMAMSTIFDLVAEAFPAAATALDEKLKARQKAAEEAMEMQKTQALAEADQALAAAREADERRALDEIADGYKDNIVPFRSRSGDAPWEPEGEDLA